MGLKCFPCFLGLWRGCPSVGGEAEPYPWCLWCVDWCPTSMGVPGWYLQWKCWYQSFATSGNTTISEVCVIYFVLMSELILCYLLVLPPFSLIRDFGKQNTLETFPKFPSVLHVIDRSDRNPPITATSVTFRPSLRHASRLWWVDFNLICR